MSIQKKELYNVIETLPEELSDKVIDYIEYIKFSHIMNDRNVPKELIVKNKKDLVNKLEDGEKDIENGEVCSSEELFSEIDKVLAN